MTKRRGAEEIKEAADRVWIPPVRTATPPAIPVPAVQTTPPVTAPHLPPPPHHPPHHRGRGSIQIQTETV